MKVILLQDVPKVGETGSIQTVSPGFARNYLIPQGLAEMATPGRLKVAQERLAAQQRRIEKEEQAQQALADRIEGTVIQLEARVGEQGRLYGSITAADVAEKLTAQLGEEIDRRKVLLDDPIRTVGEHKVTVHLVGRLRPTVTVVVAGEAEPEGEAVAAEAVEAAEEGAEEAASEDVEADEA